MRRAYLAPIDPNDEKIKRLEEELSSARFDIINLMPEEKRQILLSFFRVESRPETYIWKDQIAEKLLGMAEVVKSYNSERAYCPLCGGGTSGPYESGFSVPLGLTRHLTGWGNVRECSVVAAASAIAHKHWNEKFAPAEREKKVKDVALIAERKASEPLFLLAPDREPCLLEDGLFGRVVRSKDEMDWVEQRLSDLGFRTSTEDRVKSYVDEQDQYLVYADPRAKGRIDFTAYRRPPPKKTKSSRVTFRRLGSFHILDTWKNDLTKKYQEWVTKSAAESPHNLR